jgi:hypothetical protein
LPCVEVAGVEGDFVVMVAEFDAGVGELIGGELGNLVEAIAAVIGNQTATAVFNLAGKSGIANLDFVGQRSGAGGILRLNSLGRKNQTNDHGQRQQELPRANGLSMAAIWNQVKKRQTRNIASHSMLTY